MLDKIKKAFTKKKPAATKAEPPTTRRDSTHWL